MIRPAVPADAPAVRYLQELLPSRAPRLLETAVAVDGPGEVIVADDGGIVGYALAVPGAHDATPSSVYLAELAVAEDARRCGVGTSLVEWLTTRHADYDEVSVVVAVDAPARGFYESLGFTERKRLPDRFGDIDGVLLFRRLS
ncbi:GNAT family N-acetyltransferase [Halosegnis sp.]|uniref:GNAT family N-acetyltransferase n=1 Tax=Halosegnis sp. TaxID=2864959 RepID=UPI0035D52459